MVSVYTNLDANAKRSTTKRYYLPKGIIDSYNVIISDKNFYDQAIHSDRKPYEEIRKLATEPGVDYSTRCLLDYEYIKNYCRLIAVDILFGPEKTGAISINKGGIGKIHKVQ